MLGEELARDQQNDPDCTLLLRALLDSCPLAVLSLDSGGAVRLWNAGAERMFGWTAEEVTDRPYPACKDDNLSGFFQALGPRLHGNSFDGVDLEARQKNGSVLHVRLWSTPLRKPDEGSLGTLVMLADLTKVREAEAERLDLIEREQQARAAALAERRFRELLQAAPDAILQVTPEGRIVLLNAVAEKLFGYSREELLENSIELLIPETLRAQHVKHRVQYGEHPTTRPMGSGLNLLARRKDGTTFPVEISLSPVPAEDTNHVMAIVRDISDRKRVEEQMRLIQEQHHEELAAANAQLELRNVEVERANRLKSEFLASMSHELRTPLHTIIGFAELLGEEVDGESNPQSKRFIEHIRRDSRHLLDLINDILDLSKIEAGRLELRCEQFELEPALDEALASIRPSATSKHIEIETRVAESLTLFADRVRFKEILYNLLSNAVKFTPSGGRIEIGVLRRDASAEISVTDTGIGIPEEEHEAIFDAFRQVAATTKGIREGTGLGLAITKRLVEQHGGAIRVASKPGQGSSFTFTIPRHLAGPAVPGASRNKPLILVIDDELSARELLRDYLTPSGFDVAVAASADEGIRMMRLFHPDAITLDLVMEGNSGWKVLHERLRDVSTAAIPVVIVSILDETPAAMKLGALAHLTKPVNRDRLLSMLRRFVPRVREQ